MTAQDIIDRIGTLAHDDDHVRWTVAELLMWIGDALQQIVSLRPDAHPETVTVDLVAGADQTLPDAAMRLLDVPHNIVNDAPGKVVTLIDRETLDRFDRNWKGGKKSATVQHFMYEARDPRRFVVYPPTNGEAKAALVIATAPTAPAAAADALDIDARYSDAIVAYVMFRCFSKPGESADSAQQYAGQFASLMTTDKQASIGFAPNQNADGGKVNTAGIANGGV